MMKETKQSMTLPCPNFFIDKCRDIALKNLNDPKTCHIELNDYFREVLKELGYEYIEAIFNDLPDWYIMVFIHFCLREKSQEKPSIK